MTTIVATGLSDAAVAKRVAEGKTNDVPTRAARSVSEIVRGVEVPARILITPSSACC